MRFTELDLAGAYLIDLEPHLDERGFFARTFDAREFEERGLFATIAQCSTSFNASRGTLRGLHYQLAPQEEAKVVRCTAGAIFDVIVDVREGSPTYRKWCSAELTAGNLRALYIPPGMAHGFQTLADSTDVFYQMSTEYVPDAARGIRWSDPQLDIKWPIGDIVIMSSKDAALPELGV